MAYIHFIGTGIKTQEYTEKYGLEGFVCFPKRCQVYILGIRIFTYIKEPNLTPKK